MDKVFAVIDGFFHYSLFPIHYQLQYQCIMISSFRHPGWFMIHALYLPMGLIAYG